MKKKILIIDDNLPILNSLHMFLEFYHYDVETAQNGTYLFEKDKAPDILLIDYHIPSVNSINLVQQIRNDQRFSNTPIILMTGDINIENISMLLNVEDFIAKPLNLDDLLKKLNTSLLAKKLKKLNHNLPGILNNSNPLLSRD